MEMRHSGSILVTFPHFCEEKQLKKEGLVLAHSLRVHTMVKKAW